MSYIFQIIHTESQPVLSVQTTTAAANLPHIVGDVYASIIKHLTENGQEPLGPAFIAYHNMDMEHLLVEIGFPIAEEIDGKGEITLRFIPPGKKAVGYHKGAYHEINALYKKMAAWVEEKGLVPTGVVYEYYYNSPQEVAESELITKVEVLLEDILPELHFERLT